MIEDRELDSWKQQWAAVAEPSADFQAKIRRRIEHESRRFVIGNVLSAIAFMGILVFAIFMRSQASRMGTGWAAGLCVLVFVSVGLRLWTMRGAWRAQSQSTRAFAELWRTRAQARIRLLRVSIFVSLGWLVFCAVLTVENWPVIGRDVKARPAEWIELLVLCVVMQPVIWFWAVWLRRRKVAELEEVKKILSELKN